MKIEDKLSNVKTTYDKIKEYGFYVAAGITTLVCLYKIGDIFFNRGVKWEEREIILGKSNANYVIVEPYKKDSTGVTGLRPGEKVALRDPTIETTLE